MNLQSLEGQWYINLTTFPMWLKGDKTAPSLNYKVQTKRGVTGLSDKVIYTKNGEQKTIEGFDKPKGNNHFVWRGKGILSLLTSKWHIAYHDPNKEWMIIVFEKTLFTPAGVDVVSKQKELSESNWMTVSEQLMKLGITQTLQQVRQV